MARWFSPLFTLSAATLFWVAVSQQDPTIFKQQERPQEIVVAGPIQVVLYGGDRFLAANIESIRASASATTEGADDFRMRAHHAVSRLNPCHEDNYWVGNAALSWGGAEEAGFELLRNAMHCRYWDEWPAFFYGFNQNFFRQNVPEARRALKVAADRSKNNAAAFLTFSAMLAAGEIDNTGMAVKMLSSERDKTQDPKLREMLNKRVVRLQGLLTLRNAQADFEARFNKPLTQPQELLDSGLLENFPDDPLGLGFEFRDHGFHLRQMKFEYTRQ